MRKKLLAVYCIFSLTFPAGCLRSTASEWRNREARRVYHSASPSELAQEVRPVVSSAPQKIPHETPTAADQLTADETETLLRLVQQQPDNVAALRRLANAYLAGGHFELALERYRALQRVAPEDAEIELAMARAHDGLGNEDRALRHAQLAASSSTAPVAALELLANLHHRRKDYAKAVEIYLAALGKAPRKFSLLVSLGEAYLQLKQWSEARSYLAAATAINPSEREVQISLALAEICLGKPEQAIRQLVSQRSGLETFNQLGGSLMRLGMWREARLVFRQALRLHPNDVQARLSYKEADSYIAPPAIVSLPSFSSVPDAAVDLAPLSNPPQRAEDRAKTSVAERTLVVARPQREAPPRPAFVAAEQEAAERSVGVKPNVFLGGRPETEETVDLIAETEATSRQAQVTIPSFDDAPLGPQRDSTPQTPDEPAREPGVKAVVLADSSATLRQTARVHEAAPSSLERPPAIVNLSWRKIVEAVAGTVILPARLTTAARTGLRVDESTSKTIRPEYRPQPQSSQPGVAGDEENRPQSRPDVHRPHMQLSLDPLGSRFFVNPQGWSFHPRDPRERAPSDAAESVQLARVAGNYGSSPSSRRRPQARKRTSKATEFATPAPRRPPTAETPRLLPFLDFGLSLIWTPALQWQPNASIKAADRRAEPSPPTTGHTPRTALDVSASLRTSVLAEVFFSSSRGKTVDSRLTTLIDDRLSSLSGALRIDAEPVRPIKAERRSSQMQWEQRSARTGIGY